MTKTFIVLISVDHDSAREVCNFIENRTFKNYDEFNKTLRTELDAELTSNLVLTFAISDFMEAVNDQELDVLTEYFMSYVQIETV